MTAMEDDNLREQIVSTRERESERARARESQRELESYTERERERELLVGDGDIAGYCGG